MRDILEFESIKKFLDTVGKDIEKYFGKDDAAIVSLRPNGFWYAEGVYEWLKKRGKKNITISTMDDAGIEIEVEKVKGRKVLVVDADVITGKAYKRSMEGLRLRKRELGIKDAKFATFIDRVGLTDFSVWNYSPEEIWHFDEMNVLDLKIIAKLSENGREPFANIGKEINLSAVSVKNRVDRLLKERIIAVRANLNVDQFYTMSAQIYVEADPSTVEKLIEKCEKKQEVYNLVRTIGMYNLAIGILAHHWHNVEDFVEHEVRKENGVRTVFVITGEVPIFPKTIPAKLV